MNDDTENEKEKGGFRLIHLLIYIPLAVLALDMFFPMVLIKTFRLDNTLFLGTLEAIGLDETKQRAIHGDDGFDAIAGLKTATEMTRNQPLLGFSISKLRRDGTVDLAPSEKAALVMYRFGQPERQTPVIDGVGVMVFEPGSYTRLPDDDSDFPYRSNIGFHSRPVQFQRAPIVDPPKCTLKELWDTAAKIGADTSRTASVTYDAAGFRFRIPEDEVDLHFWIDCGPK